ncbi:hypothetical protein [Pseudolactococcus insecticola]|uniref:Uncharacterized protein n=1 Tax=Pseudolactococcus insecticola TaxID=2709158 RepID=A0A6A0B895_9LACT|nr:hypothetical protein [Lactococcus insecticola]GFH40661.1 hypothetical protein Hs20B_10590 [Lactococcus insecticola]
MIKKKKLLKLAGILLFAGSLALCTPITQVFAKTSQSTSSSAKDEKDDKPADNDTPPNATVKTVTITEAQMAEWKKAYPALDLTKFLKPTDPSTITPHTPTATDIAAFKEWIKQGGNPRNQVMQTVTAKVGETVANQMCDYLQAKFWQPLMNKANVASVVTETSGKKNVGAMQQG